MNINEAKYTRRYNLGDYEHEEFTLSAVADGEEKGASLLAVLKREVIEAHKTVIITEVPEEPKKEKKNGKSKTNNAKDSNEDGEDPSSEDSGYDGKGDKDYEAASTEASYDDNNSAEGGEDDSASEESREEEVPAKGKRGKASKEPKEEKSEKGKKAHRRKPQHYDRSIEQHKDKFKIALESVAPDWKKNEESKRKAKKASENLEGDEFLDENGDVMPEFITKIRKLMK